MTSELSNALNPHVVQQRRRRSAYTHNEQNAPANTAPQMRPALIQPPQPSTRHRSELELAVIEPPPPPPRPPAPPKPLPKAAQALQQLAHAMIATKHAADQERTRRIAWEQEQEAKYQQRQAELEQKIASMQSEMSLLKAVVTMQQPPFPAPQAPTIPQGYLGDFGEQVGYEPPYPAPAAYIEEVQARAATPQYDQDPYAHSWQSVSPTEQSPPNSHPPLFPAFEEGCSSRPLSAPIFTPNHSLSHSPSVVPSPNDGWTASPSPSVMSPAGGTDASSSIMSPSSTSLGKRRTPPRSSSRALTQTGDSSADESDASAVNQPRKRRNGHDNRCLTIQAAIRKHIFRCMQTEPSEPLPPAHVDGTTIAPSDPLRFDWTKTAKKSKHNALMRKRIVADLKANRKLYKHVPEKDFNDKTLEAGFDQAFTTLRQKFKTQQDDAAAMHNRWREDQKAMKARRKERKKSKLATRTASRARLPTYAHPTFDSALQLDCMSSEESESETTFITPSGETGFNQILRVRGLPWRSTRLQRLYAALDAAAESPTSLPSSSENDGEPENGKRRRPRAPASSTTRTKERRPGPLKDGLHLPPQGVCGWMVSRRWVRDCVDGGDAEVEERVEALVDDTKDEGFDWGTFSMLGNETDDEPVRGLTMPEPWIPRSDTSYALANALQAPS